MEYNPALPIYLQVANSIKRDIVTGRLELGARLPSVRDLAVAYTINPNTVSRVYKELEMEDVCFTRRGMGTFVTQDSEKVKNMKREMAGTLIYEFLEGMKQLGFTQEEAIKVLEQSEFQEKEKK
ncbi:GntR family transcriptional regulator [Lacrimispora saccharolytica]|nr:GntR family transcriptional regulator [Lacrimispora saccharolytica]